MGQGRRDGTDGGPYGMGWDGTGKEARMRVMGCDWLLHLSYHFSEADRAGMRVAGTYRPLE